MLIRFANAGLRFLIAPVCVSCEAPLERPLDGPVCAFCWRAVPRLTPPCCARCGDACASADVPCTRCHTEPPVFDAARSAGEYDGSLRAMIHAFKYGRCRALAAPLADLMRDAGEDVLRDADALVPVPLHPWRHAARGFNQADDLARRLGKPVWRALRRRHHGPPQSALSSARRHANVARAFRARDFATIAAVPPSLRLIRLFDGPTVVLVDDVLTTGATANACARALMDAGARSVRVLTIARAVAGRPARRPRLPDLLSAHRQ